MAWVIGRLEWRKGKPYFLLAFSPRLLVSVLFFMFMPAQIMAASLATMSTPVPGSTLSGATVAFGWTSGSGVAQYWLYVGTTSGGADLYSQNQGTRLSTMVGGLPIDGRAIYVRLWSFIGNTWYYNDYRYIAFKQQTPVATTIISPPNGSTFSSTTVTFSWTNTSAQEYRLSIGRTFGGAEIYNVSQGVSTSQMVNSLPMDGSRIYVRLSSRFGATWLYNDYNYIAYKRPAVAATMIAPQNGSTLSGPVVQFSWTRTSADEYRLSVGRTLQGTDLFNASQGTSSSVILTTLPTDGSRIYVRLWSRFLNQWLFTDDDYLAFRPSLPGTTITSRNSTSKYALAPLNLFSSEAGQCTWYVYGRVLELIAAGDLPSSLAKTMSSAFDPAAHPGQRNANQWPARLGGHWIPTNASSALPIDRRRTGLLAVYPGPLPNGHVGFVEEISSDKKRFRMSEFNRDGHSNYSTTWYYFDHADVPRGSSMDADGSLGPAPAGGSRYYPMFYDPSDSKW